MGKLVTDFALAHQDYVYGIACGALASHWPELLKMAFNKALDVPWFHRAILKDPAASKAIADKIDAVIDSAIDAAAKSDAVTTVPVPMSPNPQK